MRKQLPLVTFRQAKLLKALGFDWEVYHAKTDKGSNIECVDDTMLMPSEWLAIPTVALALKWIRDVKGIACEVFTKMNRFNLEYRWRYRLGYAQTTSSKRFSNYEEAESALLNTILIKLENQNK